MSEETPCPNRGDKIHCTCWYDGGKCCQCGDGAMTKEEMYEQGMTPRGPHPVFG